MLEEMKTLRDVTIVEWEEVLKKAQAITVGFVAGIDEVDEELITRAAEMHNQIAIILSRGQHRLREIQVDGLAKLKAQEKTISDKLQQLREDVERYEYQLQNGDPNALLQFIENTRQSSEKTKPPSLNTAAVPIFTPGLNDSKSLEQMFGQLNSNNGKAHGVENDQLTSEDSTSLDSVATIIKSPQTSSCHDISNRHLITQPTVLLEFYVHTNVPYIACTEEDQAWVMTRHKTLQLLDRYGSAKDTIRTDFGFSHIALTLDGEILLADNYNSCIKVVSKQKKNMSKLFKYNQKPTGLCCLHNGDIVMAFFADSKVIVYSRTGIIRRTLDLTDHMGVSKVAASKANQDIYICGHEKNSTHNGKHGKLIAVSSEGQLRYEYKGLDEERQGRAGFNPMAVCTDQMGHVLVTDGNKYRVHILSQEGQFIQYILGSEDEFKWPRCISVDKEGFVWIGECNHIKGHRIKVAKYLHCL